MGFFFDQPARSWIRFCEESEVQPLNDWLKRHHLSHEVHTAKGRGETKKHAKLSDELVLKNGGSPTRCALCAHQGRRLPAMGGGRRHGQHRLSQRRALFPLRRLRAIAHAAPPAFVFARRRTIVTQAIMPAHHDHALGGCGDSRRIRIVSPAVTKCTHSPDSGASRRSCVFGAEGG